MGERDHHRSSPILAAENLRKNFRRPNGEYLEVLKGISLEIYPGEMVAITGPSGSGKSTLLHILGLMSRSDGGTLSLFGKDTGLLSEKERDDVRRRRIGFLFQFDSLLEELSIEENLRLVLKLRKNGVKRTGVKDIKEMAERFNIGHRLDVYPKDLSVGECCRANLMRAVLGEPDILFADEPTGNLDGKNAKQLLMEFEAQISVKSRGRAEAPAVILATHNIEIAAQAHRTLNLESGILMEVK
ncbi:MAG: ATP-binding cassette domain-containing protein [Elusimicrobiota bacterium]